MEGLLLVTENIWRERIPPSPHAAPAPNKAHRINFLLINMTESASRNRTPRPIKGIKSLENDARFEAIKSRVSSRTPNPIASDDGYVAYRDYFLYCRDLLNIHLDLPCVLQLRKKYAAMPEEQLHRLAANEFTREAYNAPW